MMKIQLNGEDKSLNANSNLYEAIEQWQLSGQNFAVAINEQFIPKSAYNSTQLSDGDRIELVVPMQGG